GAPREHGQWRSISSPEPAGIGSDLPPRRPAWAGASRRSFLPTKTRGVLARVLMTVLSLALVVGVILAAQPAGARGRRPHALADAASAALAALGQRRQAYAAVAESVLEPGDRAVV